MKKILCFSMKSMKNNDNIDDIDDYLSQFMLPKQEGAKPSVEVETNEENDNIDDFLNFYNKSNNKKK